MTTPQRIPFEWYLSEDGDSAYAVICKGAFAVHIVKDKTKEEGYKWRTVMHGCSAPFVYCKTLKRAQEVAEEEIANILLSQFEFL